MEESYENKRRLVLTEREFSSDTEVSIYLISFLDTILEGEEIPDDIIDRESNKIRRKYLEKIREYSKEFITGNYNMSEVERKLFIYLDKYLGY